MGSIKAWGQDPAFFSSCQKKTNIYVFISSGYSGILSSFSTRYPTLKSENTSYFLNMSMFQKHVWISMNNFGLEEDARQKLIST